MTNEEAAWLAGILEGEGCFDLNHTKQHPRIRIEMRDEDIVIRVAELCGGRGKVRKVTRSNPRHSDTYSFQSAAGKNVKSVFEAIYPWMGKRRQEKLDALLAYL